LLTNPSHAARLIDFGAPVERGTLNVEPEELATAEAILGTAKATRSVDGTSDVKGYLFEKFS
jgi:hypothetical protein